jgi:hypothetical protein
MNDIEEYLSREKLKNMLCCGTSRILNKLFLNKTRRLLRRSH